MASRSFKLRLHVFGSKFHKWLALLIGIQVLLWMATGALMSFLDLERVRSEHVILRSAEVLPRDALVPDWLQGRSDIVSISTRALSGRTVIELKRTDGSMSLHRPLSGERLSPLPETFARAIAERAWVGPETSIADMQLVGGNVGTEFRGPFPAWQVTFADPDETRLYIDASSGVVLSARSDTWRLFDFIWGLHIMDWTQRDRINSWWLLVFAIGGTLFALSGFILLANRMPKVRRRLRQR